MSEMEPGPSSPKRRKVEPVLADPQSQYVPKNTKVSDSNSRPAHGLEKFYHGIAYQVQWNMVVAIEAKHRLDIIKKESANIVKGADNLSTETLKSAFIFKTKDFKTEDPDAGKFDDVVWKYEIDKQNRRANKMYDYNFLQAKHISANTKIKEISLNELLKPKQKNEPTKMKNREDPRPFALEKYFLSYKNEIKKKYEDGDIMHLIIATNININRDLEDNLLSQVEEGSISILDLIEKDINKKFEAWKIKGVGSPLYETINKLLQDTYDETKLVNELVESVYNSKPITEGSFFCCYLFDLIKKNIINEFGKFSSKFLESSDELSQEANDFYAFLKVGFENKIVNIDRDFTIPNPKDIAELVALKIENHSDFAVTIMRESKIRKIIDDNIDKLANYVLVEDEEKKIRFSNIFWTEDKLPGNLDVFRCELKKKLEEARIIQSNDSGSGVAVNLRRYTFKITGKHPETGKAFKTCKEILVDEEAFWKSFQINIDPLKLKLIKLAVDEKGLSTHNIVCNGSKFFYDFTEGNSNLPPENLQFREFLLTEGFENQRKSLKNDFNNNFNMSEPDKFAEEISLLIGKDNPNNEVKIEKRKSIIAENILKLSDYVFVQNDTSEVKFSHLFWERKNLPGNLKDFREKLSSELVKYSVIDQQDANSAIAEKLQKYSFKIADFRTCAESLVDEKAFLKTLEKGDIYTNIVAALPFNKKLPNKSLKDIQDEINYFLSKLRFVVNYSQTDLLEFIKTKSIDFTGFQTDYAFHEFQVKVANALNVASGDFISNVEQVMDFFRKSIDQMNALALIGLTLEYKAKIKRYGIEFRREFVENLLKLKDGPEYFLNSKQTKQIFYLSSEQKDLTCIKLIQVLGAENNYQNQGTYTSLSLNSLLLLKTQVVNAFKLEKSNNLLIIRYEAAEDDIDKLDSELLEVLNNKNKKIIFIAQKNDNLATKFKKCFSVEFEEKDDMQIGLVDLTNESQEEFLKESSIIYQGKEIILGKLINEESKELISGELFFDLIEGRKITVGSSLPSNRDPNSPVLRKVMKEITEHHLKTVENDIFVISGINRKLLARKLKVEEDSIGVVNKKIIFSQKDAFQLFILDSINSDENMNDFNKFCRQYEKSLSIKETRKEVTLKQAKKCIHFIEFHNDKFIWNSYFDLELYIDRYFDNIPIDEEKLTNEFFKGEASVKNLFLVGTIQKDSFVQDYGIEENKVASTSDELEKDKPIFILSKHDEVELAQETFKNLDPNFNVHWIEINRGKFFWKRSNGNIEVISKLRRDSFLPRSQRFFEMTRTGSGQCSDKSGPEISDGIPENSLVDIIQIERLVVIADIPGMGKSTSSLSLSKFYKKHNPLNWVIVVNLRECEDSIDVNLSDCKDSLNFDSVVKFLSEIDTHGLQNLLAKIILRSKLCAGSDEDGVFLLLDGFDEIRGDSEYKSVRQTKIVKLLEFLNERSIVKVLITTRPYELERKSLKDTLPVLSYNFCPISRVQGRNFLERVWQNRLKLLYKNELHLPHLRDFAKALCDRRHKIFGRKLAEFIGIPLQLQMLAEAYPKSDEVFETYRKTTNETAISELFKDLNFSSLYADFIAIKHEIYFQEKNRFGKTVTDSDKIRLKKSYEKDHKRLAFEYYFTDTTSVFELFFSDDNNRTFFKRKLASSSEVQDLSRVGILYIKKSNKIDFVHRTFAEYFISELIFERFQKKLTNPNYTKESKKKMLQFLLHNVFLQRDYEAIRSFMNSKLSSHDLILDFETSFSQYKGIVRDLLGKKVEMWMLSNLGSLGGTPLEVTAEEGLSKLVEFILKIAPSSFIYDRHRRDHENVMAITPLYYAIGDRHLDVVKVLMEYAKKIGKCQDIINSQDNTKLCGSYPALMDAAKLGPFEMVETLVESGACLTSKVLQKNIFSDMVINPEMMKEPYEGFTPLHFALMGVEPMNHLAKNDKLKIVQYLLEKGSDILAKDVKGNTALHFACVGSHQDSICLIREEKTCNGSISNSEFFVPKLRKAVSSHSLEMVEKIVSLLIEKALTSTSREVSDYINAGNEHGFTAIFLAAASGLWKMVDHLMCSVERVDHFENIVGTTTLHYLAAEVKVDLTNTMKEFLTKSGVDVNVKTSDTEETPLHWAAKNNNVRAVEFLLSFNGINRNAKNKNDETALDLARLRDCKDVIGLLEGGAN